MLPIAIPRSCASAADAVIAISGRFVATASRIAPPRASPSPSRMSSASVELESRIPASQTVAAAARKIRTSGARPRPANTRQFVSDQEHGYRRSSSSSPRRLATGSTSLSRSSSTPGSSLRASRARGSCRARVWRKVQLTAHSRAQPAIGSQISSATSSTKSTLTCASALSLETAADSCEFVALVQGKTGRRLQPPPLRSSLAMVAVGYPARRTCTSR